MKTKNLILLFSTTFAVMQLNACSSQKNADNAHTSQNSLDWAGIYKGAFASTQCKNGEVITIQINSDLTYSTESTCIGEKTDIRKSNGTFKWNRLGNEITLTDTDTKNKTIFFVGEDFIRKVSENGKKVAYAASDQNIYKKIREEEITEKYWKLIELRTNPVVMDESMNREAHIILKVEDNRLTGTGGCNFLNGSYELGEGNRIKFSEIATTQMACANMAVEDELYKVLEQVDNYTLSADGNYLSLNKGRMAPLARFEVVYLR